MEHLRSIFDVFSGDTNADRVVPPSGFTSRLTSFTAGAMAFLTVFALALSLATGRLADRWDAELARTSTIRISAPEGQMAAQSEAVLEVLRTTPGIASARVMSDGEQRKLLEPWFGPDLPLETLPVPRLIEVLEDGKGPDMAGLKLRLSAEAPGAVLDDHTRWRRPLVAAATRLRILGLVSILLIAGSTAAMITLAAQSALAANGQVIGVLRLIGARDVYIARAFVRRFTLRALIGAALGTAIAMIGVAFMPAPAEEGAFLTGLGFVGWHWILPLAIPFLAAMVAFWATRLAAFRALSRLS
ncbi:MULTISPECIES: FtsX-like permease family protein [Rhodobacterales]|uniref:cell division protein FtsX n=1 Tax=Roseobacter sp. N2S TaxID=2663844 RepID=UPI00285FBEB1|nr:MULTISPECIES: FtsX-like permease family protein [Rhodobacterales]MDR6263712.1 cell division transport system permease protein [Roseobacter sp. N2S]